MHMRRRLLTTMAALTAAVVLTGGQAQAGGRFEYVALGDSAAAGPLIPNQNVNLLCLRSDRNYPNVIANRTGATLTDVSCSGAEIGDLTGRRFGILAPQLDALKPSTDLVTLTIGANDIDLFPVALSCINFLPEPFGRSCEQRYTGGGEDELAGRLDVMAPKFDSALAEIRRRAPYAEIVVTGYGTYTRPGGCFPVQPLWGRDADYLQSVMNRVSATARKAAHAHNVTFVDLAPVTVGHDVCAAPKDRYLEGLIPVGPAAPIHPNENGMRAYGNAILDVLR
ncbi:SGNH/GDSL hydrolase family protein [Amycolatopsis sp. NPDC052450]|uniref:SGNH/GDSL hydrolase family protein n=1 Tax=Amycolatopsis sp. NPDC052450 TaxID=3363937 RepID=UPI0037C74C95